jgi:hypothetical protein
MRRRLVENPSCRWKTCGHGLFVRARQGRCPRNNIHRPLIQKAANLHMGKKFGTKGELPRGISAVPRGLCARVRLYTRVHNTTHDSTIPHTTTQYSKLPHNTTRYHTLHHNTTQFNTILHSSAQYYTTQYYNTVPVQSPCTESLYTAPVQSTCTKSLYTILHNTTQYYTPQHYNANGCTPCIPPLPYTFVFSRLGVRPSHDTALVP